MCFVCFVVKTTMLGIQLHYLRERRSLSRAELAMRAGINETELARIETGKVAHVSGKQLLALADGLQLTHAHELARLVQLNGTTRRFRAYVVGLSKTGTNSLYGIFGNYACAHDFWQGATREHLIAFRRGAGTRAMLAEFMHERDRAACAELDAGNMLVHVIDVLAELFPEAKFVGLIRDPFSWVNAQVNYFTLPEHQALTTAELPSGFPFDLPRGVNSAKTELIQNFPRYAEDIIAYWANSTRAMLAQLPAERSLVIRTHEIAMRVDDLAQFIGVPVETLRRDQTHLNRAQYHVNALQLCDREFLRGVFDTHCNDLLAPHFPGFSLDRFLDSR